MIGHKPNIFWQATWRVVSPLIMLFIFVFYVVNKAKAKPTYNTWNPSSVCVTTVLRYVPQISIFCKLCFQFKIFSMSCLQAIFPVLETVSFPSWVYVIIFLLAGIPSLCIPGFALYKLFQRYCC